MGGQKGISMLYDCLGEEGVSHFYSCLEREGDKQEKRGWQKVREFKNQLPSLDRT